MIDANAHFADTTAVALALQAQLQAVLLSDGKTPAFQRVELFDSESLLDAFALLTISEQRMALVVPLNEHWETELKTPKLLTRRTQVFGVIMSDRVLGRRYDALYGNAQTPGAFGLQALALPKLAGQLIANPGGVVVTPKEVTVLILKNEKEKQNLPGRAAVVLEVDCQGGWMETILGKGPTL